jgi:mRNA interferase RelE/StbE
MEIVVTPEAREQYEELPVVIKLRVKKIIERLKAWPKVSGAKALKGQLAGKWRMRTGDYRVQFSVSEAAKTITVEKIGHRAKFYDDQG